MKILLLLAAFLAVMPGSDRTGAILTITGAVSLEDLDEQTVERFESLASHPLKLNLCGRSRLLSSGLLTEYQTASLLDYRSRTGDIMSWSELSLVDGFSPALAKALQEFCSLESSSAPGIPESRKASHDLMVRAAVKGDGHNKPDYSYGAKYNFLLGERLEVNWGSRTTYSDSRFTPGTASVAYYGKGRIGKIVAGDFNARYGQGLLQWSGFSMSSYSSVTAMMRKGTGISASRSFTRSLHGIGADFDLGRWSVSGAWSWPGTALAHLGWNGRKLSLGAGAKAGDGTAFSLDWQAGTASLCFYGEGCWSPADGPALTSGLVWSPAYGVKTAALCKLNSKGTQTVAGFQNKWLSTTFDAIWNNSYKVTLMAKPSFEAGPFTLTPALRVKAAHKPGDKNPTRIEVRAEGSASWNEWMLSGRYERVWCQGASWLWYAEGGYRSDLSAYLRFSLFKIDAWPDRIYVYERDAPGNFNVPAYYGRGLSASAVVSCKFRKQCLHLRASTVQYLWNLSDKSPKLELKIQYQLKL